MSPRVSMALWSLQPWVCFPAHKTDSEHTTSSARCSSRTLHLPPRRTETVQQTFSFQAPWPPRPSPAPSHAGCLSQPGPFGPHFNKVPANILENQSSLSGFQGWCHEFYKHPAPQIYSDFCLAVHLLSPSSLAEESIMALIRFSQEYVTPLP